MTQEEEENKKEQQPTLAEAIEQALNGLAIAAKRTFESFMPVLRAMYERAWENYREAGMPYGESHEGLMQWVRDLAKIRREKQERERKEMLLSLCLPEERIRAEQNEEGQQKL